MEGVAGVLEHFGLFKFQLEDWCIDVHGCPQVSKGILLAESVAANDYVRRFVKIAHGAAFAKEFWIEIDREILARFKPGTFDKHRQSHRCSGARENGAANANEMGGGRRAQEIADLLCSVRDVV